MNFFLNLFDHSVSFFLVMMCHSIVYESRFLCFIYETHSLFITYSQLLHVVSAGEITTFQLNEKKLVGRSARKLNEITRKFDASS